jgi:hypothetical protein
MNLPLNWSFFSKSSLVMITLGCQIDEYTRLFGTKETWRKKQTQRQTKIFNKNPPYSFIWPYSFNWHLRVPIPKIPKKCQKCMGMGLNGFHNLKGSQDFDFFNCNGCRIFILYEIHWDPCPRIFGTYYSTYRHFEKKQNIWQNDFIKKLMIKNGLQCNINLVTLNLVTTCDLVTILQRPFFQFTT